MTTGTVSQWRYTIDRRACHVTAERRLEIKGIPVYVLVSLIFFTITVEKTYSAPITFNTALPVAKGEGIIRVQTRYLRATDDTGTQDRELTVWAIPVVGAYGVTGRLALFGVIPVIDKRLELNTPAGRISRGSSGVGDITVMARYTLWGKDLRGETLRFAPFLGIEIPTGDDNKRDNLGRLPQPLQTGSGSWDGLAGFILTWQTLEWEIDASLSYKLNTEANGFEFGDDARMDISYQYRLLPKDLGSGVPAFVYGVLESNMLWEDKNRFNGEYDSDSGGVRWYITPGIQYVTRRSVIETAVQIPVVQDLNGGALKNDFIWIFSVRVNF